MRHLPYECPLIQRPQLQSEIWAQNPPFMSTSLLLEDCATMAMQKNWKVMCAFALKVFGSVPTEVTSWDNKGHEIAVGNSKTVACCLRCHVSRCLRDARYIATKPCAQIWDNDLAEGSMVWVQNHLLCVKMARWKRAGSRPSFQCLKCLLSFWGPLSSSPPPCRM